MSENKSLTRPSSIFDSFLTRPFGVDLFGNSFRDFRLSEGFVEYEDRYVLKVHIPVVGDSLEVTVEDGNLKISYNEKTENSVTQGSYSYSIPEDADVTTVDAQIDEKTLKVEVLKKKPTKRVEVKVK